MDNPINLLGLKAAQLKYLKELPTYRRALCLGKLRVFYSLMLHSDVTGKPDNVLAEINSAFDLLSDETEFSKAYQLYLKTSAPNISDGWSNQMKFIKSESDKEIAQLKRTVGEKSYEILGLIEAKENVQKRLEVLAGKLHNRNSETYSVLQRYKKNIAAERMKEQGVIQNMVQATFKFIAQCESSLFRMKNSKLIREHGASYFIDSQLIIWSDFTGKPTRRGKLIGFINSEEAIEMGFTNSRTVKKFNSRYSIILAICRPGFTPGFAITVFGPTKTLRILGPLTDVDYG